jgi:Flp pilus assembly protein TadB
VPHLGETGFNLEAQEKPTNQDLTITYTPDNLVMRYTYTVLKNGIPSSSESIDGEKPVNIVLDESGTYQIKIESYDYYNRKTEIESGVYKIDKDAPVIILGSDSLKMRVGSILYPMADVKAYDTQDGDLLDQVTTNVEELDFDEIGLKKLVYTVTDSAGNTTTKTMMINVVKDDTFGIILIQLGIIAALVGIIFAMLSYRRSVKLEQRIRKYSIESLNDHSLSLFDRYYQFYAKLLKRISKYVSKSVFLKKYSNRYEKYVGIMGDENRTGIDFVSAKILIAILFVVIAIISATLQIELMNSYEIVFPFLFGFFVPDILYISKHKLHRKHIENDLLQAIIIMNNAFKSGRSITQAIELVMTELDGAIAKEFKKMRAELSYGLSVDVVFGRFADRIKLEEVNYLTASLSILNKTGGNIIKVFSSIEESLFSKKKLWLELESLTSSSKMIMYVLFCVPVLFTIFVSVINPDYFLPFFTTPLGIMLSFLIVILYVIYIICVRKIMAVRM